jgi:hypothetical protein
MIQGDQNVSVHLMITIQKVISNVQCVPPPQYPTARARGTLDTLTPSVIFFKWSYPVVYVLTLSVPN